MKILTTSLVASTALALYAIIVMIFVPTMVYAMNHPGAAASGINQPGGGGSTPNNVGLLNRFWAWTQGLHGPFGGDGGGGGGCLCVRG